MPLKAKKTLGPENGIVQRPVRREAGASELSCSPEAPPGHARKQHQHAERHNAAERANIVEPFAHVDAANVEQRDDGEPKRREGDEIERIGGQALRVSAEGEQRRGGAKIEHGREKRAGCSSSRSTRRGSRRNRRRLRGSRRRCRLLGDSARRAPSRRQREE